MKKLITLFASIVCLIATQAQWASFPGTATEISCGSDTELACITSGSVFKYNFTTNSWTLMTGTVNTSYTHVGLAGDGTLWARNASNVAASSNLVKFNVPATAVAFTAITGLLDNISVGSNTSAIGSVSANPNNIYRTTSATNAFSLFPSVSFAAKKVVVAPNGDVVAMNFASQSNNLFEFRPAVQFWNTIPSTTTINASDIAIGANFPKLAAVANGKLYVYYNNKWVQDESAPANVVKVTIGSSAGSKMYVLTDELTDNIYTNSFDSVVSSVAVSSTLSGFQNICAIGATTTFSSTISGGTWSSSNTAVATVNATTGVVTAVAAGSATISYTVATAPPGSTNTIGNRTVTVLTTTPDAGILSGPQELCTAGSGSNFMTSSLPGGTWSSSNTSVMQVNPVSGFLAPILAGTVIITYTIPGSGSCGNATSTRTITVSAPNSADYFLSDYSNTICLNSTFQIIPVDSGGTFSSLNPSIATVDANGLVTALSPGQILISYTAAPSGACFVQISYIEKTAYGPSTNLNAIICDGETYTFGSQTLNSAGTYTETYTVSGGCDSVVTLDLNISNIPSGPVVSQNGANLSVNDDYDSYFWFNELDPLTALGSSPNFTASTSGNYYVAVYNASGCSILSDVFSVVISGIKDAAKINFAVYPNPTEESVSIENLPLGTQVKLSNLSGQTIYETTIAQNIEVLDLSKVAKGFYFISASQDGILIGTSRIVVLK